MTYGDYATSLLARKLANGELSTEKSRRTWSDAQALHLRPAFADWAVDAIRRRDVEAWKAAQGEKVRQGLFSPVTVNGWLRVLVSTLRAKDSTSSKRSVRPAARSGASATIPMRERRTRSTTARRA